MDPEAIVKAVIAVGAPIATIAGIGSRRRRLRNEIRENLALVELIEKNALLREHTPATGWLHGRIALDVARLAGQPLTAPKRPIPKGSVAMAAVLSLIFAAWTYLIDRHEFVWYSVFPAIVSLLMVISILGMTTDRELPQSGDGAIPAGAVPVSTNTPTEEIVARTAIAATGIADRFEENGQIGAALKFIRLARDGQYEAALTVADDNWILCRIQAWLWNNRDHFGDDTGRLEELAQTMLEERRRNAAWEEFVATESDQFSRAWFHLDPDQLGAASRRRRIGKDYDLVILAPVGTKGGYFVTSPTLVPDALTFVMHRLGDRWLVSSHLGTAPPRPGWPPDWWSGSDPMVESLPDS